MAYAGIVYWFDYATLPMSRGGFDSLYPHWKEDMKTARYMIMIGGLIEIANGLVKIFSFGYWQPGWPVTFTGWRIRRYIKRLQQKEKLQ